MLRSTALKDQVTVILRENREGAHGRLVPVETGRVTVWGRMRPSTTGDIEAYAAAGESGVLTMKIFHTRVFPGDDLSLVVDSEQVVYQVVGEPKRHRGSRRTSRDVVTLRQVGVTRGLRDGQG